MVITIFSEKVRILRNRMGLSQESLAFKLDVSRQTISKWELGVSYPEIDKLIELSEYFKVSIDYLLKHSDSGHISVQSLDRIVLEFLGSSQKMEDISNDLITIMQDGVIDQSEKEQIKQILSTLDTISKTIERIKLIIGLSH